MPILHTQAGRLGAQEARLAALAKSIFFAENPYGNPLPRWWAMVGAGHGRGREFAGPQSIVISLPAHHHENIRATSPASQCQGSPVTSDVV